MTQKPSTSNVLNMDKLRTPDERFHGLADWPFEPCYVNLDGDLRTTTSMKEQVQQCCSCTESQLGGTGTEK